MIGKTGSILNYLFAALSLTFGIIYLLKPSFMPYHSVALSQTWNEVDQNTRILILALMRAVSGGFIVSAISIIFLQYKFSKDKLSWIPLLIVIIGIIIESTTIYATLLVRLNTPGKPPVSLAILGLILLAAGYFFNQKSLQSK
jgi:hypothetical protein